MFKDSEVSELESALIKSEKVVKVFAIKVVNNFFLLSMFFSAILWNEDNVSKLTALDAVVNFGPQDGSDKEKIISLALHLSVISTKK